MRLEANTVGVGPTAVVFLHQTDRAGMCGFWSYAIWMADHYRIRAVLFNRCGYGRSICPTYPSGAAGLVDQTEPAVAWAHAHGASSVDLLGASVGAGDAVEAAGLVPGVAAVVAVSDAGNDTFVNEDQDARNDHLPTLLAVAPSDPLAPVETIQHLYAEIPGHPKKLIILSAQAGVHGWNLLSTTGFGLTAVAWILHPTS